MVQTTIEIRALEGIGEIAEGTDLAGLLTDHLAQCGAEAGDILVVTQKILSKAEGRYVRLSEVTPGAKAKEIADTISKDPRLIELVMSESSAIVRMAPGILITRHRLGFVMANAGIDASNLGPGADDRVLLLPTDPDAAAAEISQRIKAQLGITVPTVISDSFGRPWRHGVVNVALGCAGLPALYDKRGQTDRDGRVMQVTQMAYGDLIASAAGLAMGEGEEGIPAVILRGLTLPGTPNPAATLVRPPEEDLFR